MSLSEIITLFESVEKGEEGQCVGFHLHDAIRQASEQSWETNASYEPSFSGFLKALRDADP